MRTIQLILLGFLLLFAGRPTVAADYYWVNGTFYRFREKTTAGH